MTEWERWRAYRLAVGFDKELWIKTVRVADAVEILALRQLTDKERDKVFALALSAFPENEIIIEEQDLEKIQEG